MSEIARTIARKIGDLNWRNGGLISGIVEAELAPLLRVVDAAKQLAPNLHEPLGPFGVELWKAVNALSPPPDAPKRGCEGCRFTGVYVDEDANTDESAVCNCLWSRLEAAERKIAELDKRA